MIYKFIILIIKDLKKKEQKIIITEQKKILKFLVSKNVIQYGIYQIFKIMS